LIVGFVYTHRNLSGGNISTNHNISSIKLKPISFFFFFFFFVDNCERTARVEDSTLYFQLEEHKGNAKPPSIIQLFTVVLKY